LSGLFFTYFCMNLLTNAIADNTIKYIADYYRKLPEFVRKCTNAQDRMKRTKLLLVDDDDIQLSMAEYMLMNDYEVMTANSGEKALELLRKGFTPSLILLDILMPTMDGWETYNKIRGFFHDIPILFLTALDEAKEAKYAQEIGAVDYITKPFGKKDLLERVGAVVRSNYAS